MPKFKETYSGGTLRSLLFQYSNDRSKEDPVFKAEFDAARAEERRIRAAKLKLAEERAKKDVAIAT